MFERLIKVFRPTLNALAFETTGNFIWYHTLFLGLGFKSLCLLVPDSHFISLHLQFVSLRIFLHLHVQDAVAHWGGY